MTRYAALFDRRGGALPAPGIAAICRALHPASTGGRTGELSTRGHCLILSDRAEAAEDHAAVAGSIDNLDELAAKLGESAGEVTADSVVGRGLQRWGSGLWQRLEGSFGVACFDESENTLHLACDALGGRPLFLFERGPLVVAASEIELLLTWPGVAWALDPEQVARFFSLDGPARGRSYFSEIDQVPPGCAVEISPRGRREHNFWSFRRKRDRIGLEDQEFAAQFRDRLRRAVTATIDQPEQTGVMLSGGLDSSSLAVLAREGATGGARLAACSWIFEDLAVCDERVWIDRTLAVGDFEVVRVLGDDLWPLADAELFGTLAGAPEENPYRALKRALYLEAGERGRKLLLNGGPADVLQRGGGGYLRDLLRDGRWRDAGRALARQSLDSGLRAGLGALVRLAPPLARRPDSALPQWLTPAARRLLNGSEALGGDIRPLELQARGQALERQYARSLGIDVLSPYWTRDFVDFMLALPAHQLYRPGTHKYIARQAMRGLLPEAIRLRQRPTRLDPLFERGVFEQRADAVRALLSEGFPVWSRFVDPEFVVRVGPNSTPHRKVLLWRCLSFEHWRRRHGWQLAGGDSP